MDLYGSSLIEAPFFFWVRLYVSSVHGFSTTSRALDFGNFQGVGVTRFRGCPMGSQWVMGSLRCLLVFRVCHGTLEQKQRAETPVGTGEERGVSFLIWALQLH